MDEKTLENRKRRDRRIDYAIAIFLLTVVLISPLVIYKYRTEIMNYFVVGDDALVEKVFNTADRLISDDDSQTSFNNYKRRSSASVLKLTLSSYYSAQTVMHQDWKKFEPDMGKLGFLNSSSVTLGFSTDDKIVKKYCPDCIFSENSFKIGAYAYFKEGDIMFWTIDQKNNLVEVR